MADETNTLRSQIKILLNISDTAQDDLIDLIISRTQDRLRVLLSLGTETEIPDALEYIVEDVSVRRFNRIGSEGLSSHSVEGETMSWPENDFAPYQDDIQAYLDSQEEPTTKKGRVRFI